MTRIQFLQILKHFFNGTKNVVCDNKRVLPKDYDFDMLKKDALKYGYDYKFENNNLVIKLTDRQMNELKLIP